MRDFCFRHDDITNHHFVTTQEQDCQKIILHAQIRRVVYVFILQNVHDVEYYDGHGFDDASKRRKCLLNDILGCF